MGGHWSRAGCGKVKNLNYQQKKRIAIFFFNIAIIAPCSKKSIKVAATIGK